MAVWIALLSGLICLGAVLIASRNPQGGKGRGGALEASKDDAAGAVHQLARNHACTGLRSARSSERF